MVVNKLTIIKLFNTKHCYFNEGFRFLSSRLEVRVRGGMEIVNRVF